MIKQLTGMDTSFLAIDTPLRFQYLSPRATRTAFNTPQVEAMNREMKVAQVRYRTKIVLDDLSRKGK